MAALRHAARKLSDGTLQRAPRIYPSRRPMSTTSSINGQPQTSADELRMEFEEKKEELFDLCLEMRSTGAFKKLSWEDLQNLRLTTHLAAQVKRRPEDPNWWQFQRARMIFDFNAAFYCLGFMGYSLLGGSSKKEGEANGEANIVPDSTEPANEHLK